MLRCSQPSEARRRSVKWDACTQTPTPPDLSPGPIILTQTLPLLLLLLLSPPFCSKHWDINNVVTLSSTPSTFFLPPSSIVTGPTRCAAASEQKKAKNICFLQLPPLQPATLYEHMPPPPFDPSIPKPYLSSAYCPLPLSPPPQPPPVSSHHTRSVPVCVSRLSVTPCLQLLAQSEILQQESAATALALSLAYSLSLTPSIQPLLVNTFLPVLINFFSFPAHTRIHTHTHRLRGNWLAMKEDGLCQSNCCMYRRHLL